MEQYISKAAIVAEIEKLKEENRPNSKSISEYINGGIYGFDLAIEKTLGIIDTLEAKEVDLTGEEVIEKALDWAEKRLTDRGFKDFKEYINDIKD